MTKHWQIKLNSKALPRSASLPDQRMEQFSKEIEYLLKQIMRSKDGTIFKRNRILVEADHENVFRYANPKRKEEKETNHTFNSTWEYLEKEAKAKAKNSLKLKQEIPDAVGNCRQMQAQLQSQRTRKLQTNAAKIGIAKPQVGSFFVVTDTVPDKLRPQLKSQRP
ncbi:hypothetical protein VNO80_00469 [Phaseolus coccineus]|uniref:Uncharacterized protein n=1 Tax=Phaseolus coccineus TaxID=3886 RepID=A0AAN9NYU3_PHACN